MTPSQNLRWPVKRALYTQEMSNKGTKIGPQERSPPKNGLEYLPMKTDPKMALRANTGRKWPIMTKFYVDTMRYVRVTKDPRGNGLKIVPLTAGQVRASRRSSNYERDLRDLYFEVTVNRDADEQTANEMFQEFGALISVKFKNDCFTRRGT